MFPLIAIGGAIGATVSIAQGVSWLVDKLDSARATPSAGGKADGKPQADARASAFEAALAAQAAGQVLPTGTGNAGTAAAALPATAMISAPRGTDYDALARMKVGILAYDHVGERRDDRSGNGKSTGYDDNQPVARS
jgi:hypothetical protein